MAELTDATRCRFRDPRARFQMVGQAATDTRASRSRGR